jgi:hypothetical protein
MEVVGCETFGVTDLLVSLRMEGDLVALSHPTADRGQFLRALRDRIRSGYLLGGFPEPRITAEEAADGE